jgi:mono/diheme cytochrome c family protein
VVRSAALAALVALTAVLVAGCGAVGISTGGDPSAGKALFTEKCGSCHVMKDAGTSGTTGPNLDDAFGSVRTPANGSFDESTIRDVVRGQIAYAEPPMPQNLVEDGDADSVAAYVAKCAGVPACGVQATGPQGATTTTGTGTGTGTTTTGGGGGGGGTPAAQGKQIFAANCGGCHTLKDAGTSGTVGPNLDELKPPKAVVDRQVTNGGQVMPAFKGKLTPAQIAAVAAYVSAVAGK